MASTDLIPRATVEEIVAHRNRALELYGEAFTAIEAADRAIKAAHGEAARASGDTRIYDDERSSELEAFHKAVKLPDGDLYREVARRLTDMRVWSWVVQRTDLERLMDAEAKETLRKQMEYVPVNGYHTQNRRYRNQLMTGDEVRAGMPPVTVDNIYATIQSFAADAESIFRRGVANAFAKLDRRFRSHDGFKVGSRVILTNAFDSYSGRISYGRTRDTLIDVERAFVVLDNGSLGVTSAGCLESLETDRRRGNNGPHQSCTETKYFRIRGYQNGNAHLWFTRDDLVEKVNKILADWYGEVIGDGKTKETDPFTPKTTLARRFGFFPTPNAAAEALIERVPLYRRADEFRLKILEPSAGTGSLARRLCPGADVDCVEVQAELAAKLRAEGIYRYVYATDFLTMKPEPSRLYDRIVMNPPFDLERDIDHVMHALGFLKPDGELHAIMSAGTEFRETRKAAAFRALVAKMGGRFFDLPPGSFSSVGTNVNTCIVRLRKDGKQRYW